MPYPNDPKIAKPARAVRIRSRRLDPPDLEKLARALIELALNMAEEEARNLEQVEHAQEGQPGGA